MLAISLLLLAAAPALQDVPKLTGWVTDQAGFLSEGDKAAIEDLIGRYHAGSDNEVAVLTVPTLGGRDIESFANDVAVQNGVGDVKADNGVLLVVAAEDRKIRIEVGRGLEGELTDLVCGRIIDLVMVPEFKAGRPSFGIRRGVESIVAAAGGDLAAIPDYEDQHGGGSGIFGGLLGLLVILFLLGMLGRGMGGSRGRGGGGMGSFVTGMLLGQMLGGRGGGFGSLGGRSSGGFGGFGGSRGFGGGGASGGW